MLTEFKDIPALFVELYRPQFEIWAREYRERGSRCAIVFQRPRGAPALLDERGQVVQAGAWLTAEIEADGGEPRMIVQPASEQDADLIERHCRVMRGHVLQ